MLRLTGATSPATFADLAGARALGRVVYTKGSLLAEPNSTRGQILEAVAGPLVILAAATLFWLPLNSEFFGKDVPRWLVRLSGGAVPETYHVYLGMLKTLLVAVPLVAVELLTDHGKRAKLRRLYLFPILVWASFYLLSCVVIFLSERVRTTLNITPLLTRNDLSYWAHVALFVVLVDFFGYWFHRVEHMVPLLWRFHSTHHSIEEVGALNQYEHWFEGMFRFLAVYLPVAVVLEPPNISQSVIALIFAAWTVYAHCDSPLVQLPAWARHVFADNLYHRYHHGMERHYYDRNFANMFSIWDWMFGTRLMPVGSAFPKTGLSDIRQPANLLEYTAHPFLKRFRKPDPEH